MPPTDQASSVPPAGIRVWQDLIPQLWCDVCALLLICLKRQEHGKELTPSDPEFLEYLRISGQSSDRLYLGRKISRGGFEVPNPYLPRGNREDEHLRLGLFRKHMRRGQYPRIVSLVINALKQSRERHPSAGTSEIIPSPLFIIGQLLTDPEDLASRGYALQACKLWLSENLGVWAIDSHRAESVGLPAGDVSFDVPALYSALTSFENHERSQIRWPNPRRGESSGDEENVGESGVPYFIGHVLALGGYSDLWFERKNSDGPVGREVSKFLEIGAALRRGPPTALSNHIANLLRGTRFRRSTAYDAFPPFEEIANQVFGIPLPIRGMDAVLNGGLRSSDAGGLVVSISGKPGTGKTSLALAIADALAPFGIPTSFVALEESEGDVRNKLFLVSRYGRSRLSITQNSPDLFFCVESKAGAELGGFRALREETDLLYQGMKEEVGSKGLGRGKLPVSGVVIIDNINMLGLSESTEDALPHIEAMIRQWRKANIVFIVICAEDVAARFRFDYLADVAIEMRYGQDKSFSEKPLRSMNVIKTRHQAARQGAHLCHMTSGKGFRVAPQMEALMARKGILHRRLPDKGRVIDVFDVPRLQKRYLDLYPGSNILIHGFGSGGKAGLALKILLKTPSSASTPSSKSATHRGDKREAPPRVLIISFLYSEEYYEEVVARIERQMNIRRFFASVDSLVFSPGFLTPQDFLNMVVARLDSAIVAGTPFSGVMIDGLHNVFLQYEILQDSSVVWAMLYSILSRYNVTVVSTFTNFSASDRAISEDGAQRMIAVGSALEDSQLMQKGMTPFLHALVKATDFYLYLQEEVVAKTNKRLYILSVRSAIGQEIPEHFLQWDRQAQRFVKCLSAVELRQLRAGEPEKGQLDFG